MVTNLRPGTLRDRGLDFDSLNDLYPHLIYADLSGYGNQGAEQERPGYDMVLQARAGLMSVNGDMASPPSRVGVSILDMGTGLWLALGVLAALRLRDLTGRGDRVSTSLLEVGASFMTYDFAAFQLTGELPQRRGSEHPAFAPYGAYRTLDGYVALGIGADRLFERLALALDRGAWVTDARFASNEARVANRAELRVLLEREFEQRTTSDVIEVLNKAEVPADVVADVDQVLVDPQLAELDAWVDVPIPQGAGSDKRQLRVPGSPLRFGQRRPPVREGPPELGSGSQALYDEIRTRRDAGGERNSVGVR